MDDLDWCRELRYIVDNWISIGKVQGFGEYECGYEVFKGKSQRGNKDCRRSSELSGMS